jgi:outer membrane autotransporter protein
VWPESRRSGNSHQRELIDLWSAEYPRQGLGAWYVHWHRRRTAALFGGVWLGALATFVPNTAHTQNATWNTSPTDNNYNNSANWTPATVPSGTASFGTSSTTMLTFSAASNTVNTVGGWTFNPGASAYQFALPTSNPGLNQPSSSLTFNGAGIVINGGSATITVINGGTLIFANNSTAGSATIQSIGILSGIPSVQFMNNSTAGNATITNNVFWQFSGNSTAGNATILNSGVIDFSNTSGPLGNHQITAGSIGDTIAGPGGYALGSNQLTVGSNNLSTTVSGGISDSGLAGGTGASLVKVGTGTLTLSGVNFYTGPTTVNGGVLNVTGSLVSAVTVNSGGTLMGAGTIGGLNVASGGTVAPGNSIGTMNVAGNVSFASGAIYQAEANAAGQSDKIVASGSASLSGGKVQVLAQDGTYGPRTQYTILTATGGVTGAFDGATSNLASFRSVLSYDATDVYLTLLRGDFTFHSLARTATHHSIADALDRSVDAVDRNSSSRRLVGAVIRLSDADVPTAFDALSGEIHASVQSTMIDDSRYVRQAVLGRLRQAPYAGGSSTMAALGSGGPILAYADSAPDTALAYADAKKSTFPIKEPPLAAPVQTSDLTFWAQGVGAWGKINGNDAAADVSRTLGGFFTGFDRRFGDWRAGLAAGYTNSSVCVSARASSANIDTAYIAAYAGTSLWAWNFRSGATFAWNTIGINRSIVFPGFDEQATTRYGAGESQVFAELGYGMTFGSIATEPFAGLTWVHLDTTGFTETGGVSALTGTGNRDDVGYSTLGVRAATNYLLQNGMMLTPRASVAWQHALGILTPTASLAFASTGAGFNVTGVPLARDAALVEAGGDLQVTAQAKVGIAYTGQLANSVHDHSVKGNFTWQF